MFSIRICRPAGLKPGRPVQPGDRALLACKVAAADRSDNAHRPNPGQMLRHQRRFESLDQTLELGQSAVLSSGSVELIDRPTPCRLRVMNLDALQIIQRFAARSGNNFAVYFQPAHRWPSFQYRVVVPRLRGPIPARTGIELGPSRDVAGLVWRSSGISRLLASGCRRRSFSQVPLGT